jgi:hypothetical protein
MRQRATDDKQPPGGVYEARTERQGALGAPMFVKRRLGVLRAPLCRRARCCLLVQRGLLETLSSRTAVRGLKRDETINTARQWAPGGTANQAGVTSMRAPTAASRHPRRSRSLAGGNRSSRWRGMRIQAQVPALLGPPGSARWNCQPGWPDKSDGRSNLEAPVGRPLRPAGGKSTRITGCAVALRSRPTRRTVRRIAETESSGGGNASRLAPRKCSSVLGTTRDTSSTREQRKRLAARRFELDLSCRVR